MVVPAGIVAFVIALVLQAVWSALIVANLGTSPATLWCTPVMAVIVWLAWQYLGANGDRPAPLKRAATFFL